MNDFQNLSLFRQHQELLADMVRVDVVLEALAQTTDLRSRWTLNDEAVELIKELMQKLKAHFETETAILRSEFFEEERPLLRDALREIAEEHPDLLGLFGHALRAFEVDSPDGTIELERAILTFRDHEAREEVLFVED